jgi:hypothetical protein
VYNFPIKINKFFCDGFKCSTCNYKGSVELGTPSFFENEEKYFKIGDKVTNSIKGIYEHFDGVFCPDCTKEGKLKIQGVRVILHDGVYVKCIFD